ncbi:FG-GAP-like repeat-containing protein [Pelagicoccus sp. SDUM812005]|nr:FG-GAP-like repeat-containing protein [Pelagicoccus sp. SDUM812005]
MTSPVHYLRSFVSLLGVVAVVVLPWSLSHAAFTDVTASTPFASLEQLAAEELTEDLAFVARGGAPAVIDFDGDGWLDVYIVRFRLPDVLMRNTGGAFERIDNPLGLDTSDGGNAPLWADFDNDGDQDLFVATADEKEHRFYVNEGAGRFIEAAASRALALPSTSPHKGVGVAAGDLNRDGCLDLVVGEWGASVTEQTVGQHFAVFLNRGAAQPGYFDNVSITSGVAFPPPELTVYAPLVSDLDGDGWPDLPIVADFERSRLFWNNADGTFSDGTRVAGVSKEENGMGTAIADVNADGLLDWFVTSIRFTDAPGYRGNQLYINQGNRVFESVSDESGIATGGWGWGCDLFDYDNDGDLDVVMTNGKDLDGQGEEVLAPMILWRNEGDNRFSRVSDSEMVNHVANGAGLVTFDYDNDGDLDILVVHQNSSPVLLRNDRTAENAWLDIALQGTDSNRAAFGTLVSVRSTANGPFQTQEFNPGNTYLAQKQPLLHFGLGSGLGSVAEIRIRWPSGVEEEYYDIPTRRIFNVVESQGGSSAFTPPRFTREPEKQSLRPGDDLLLEVEVEGDPLPLVRWYRNGQPLLGAVGKTLLLEDVQHGDAGKYYATATNAAGVAYSEHARVGVYSLHLNKSVARQWMEELLNAIRLDYPAPTVHSRNLFGLACVMWDAWVAYDFEGASVPYLSVESPPVPTDILQARSEAISYAAYRLLRSRFRLSPSSEVTLPALRERMELLGYDPDDKSVVGDSPAAVGNRIAARLLAYTWTDGGNELYSYVDQTGYEPVNDPLIFTLPGTEVQDPNQWQPLSFDYLILQNGIVVGKSTQKFLGANWGEVRPFALERPTRQDVYSDPGPPPYLGGEGDQDYKDAAIELIEFSSWLDPSDSVEIDVSPGVRHNNTLGTNDGIGYEINPETGEAYEPNLVLRADYGRILAEFWADGPDSETPPGHWNSVANHVTDHPLFERRFEGEGEVVDELEWDVKLYFALDAAVSDAAIACWDAKRKYNYVRPITMIRYMGSRGQSSDPDGPSYSPEGLPLKENLVEVVTVDSSAPGQRHSHLVDHVGAIAIRSWKGIPDNPNLDYGGVGWILAVEWMPYQRDTFVTPPFGAYTSGHSAFSRAAAEVIAAITGSAYFPGGISSFTAGANEFLEFERGPTETVTLTWATYFDAADEAGISRLYGGIHVWPDDLRGRVMGSNIGKSAYAKAKGYFDGTADTVDWREAAELWANARVGEPNGPVDTADLLADPIESAAAFYFGAEPLATSLGANDVKVLRTTDGKVEGLSFLMSDALLEPEVRLCVSQDLVDWNALGLDECILEREKMGDQLVRISISAKSGMLPEGRRFLRALVRDAD